MQVRNLQYSRADKKTVDCEVYHPDLEKWVPFTAAANDSESFGKEVWIAVSGRKDISAYIAPPPIVPDEISKVQLIRALRAAGHKAAFDTALAAADADTNEDWDATATIPRNDPLVIQFGTALGLDDAAMDQLFISAVA